MKPFKYSLDTQTTEIKFQFLFSSPLSRKLVVVIKQMFADQSSTLIQVILQ